MQQLFRHEQKRLRRAISREYRETGVTLDSDLIPKMPDRVTKKQLEKIRAIKPKTLREKTTFIDPRTGKTISYEEAKRLWKEEQIQPATAQTYDAFAGTIDYYYDTISVWNQPFQDRMHAWINQLVSDFGTKAVNRMLADGMRAGLVVTPEIAYEELKRSAYMSAMLDYLQVPPELKAKFIQDVEDTQGYNEPE